MLKLNIVYHSDTTLNYIECGQFTLVMSIWFLTVKLCLLLNYGHFKLARDAVIHPIIIQFHQKELYESMLS